MRRIATFGGIAALLIGSSAGAVTTKVWTQDSYKSFDEGEADEALISSLGEVMPGTATERTNVESDALWSAVRAPDGTIYTGGVTDGTIYAVAGGKAKKLATLSEETPWIGALTLGPDGRLYVGTLGSATVHAVDVKTGKISKVAKLEGADHVWALEFVGGNLYAGTGPKGQLFEIDVKGGKAKAVWDSEETHLLSVAPASDGSLWVGTAEEAILYRFDPKTNQVRAIADFAGAEVKAIVQGKGPWGTSMIVAVNEFGERPTATPGSAAKPKGTATKAPSGGPGTDSKDQAPARSGEKKGKGGVFRVEADGRVEQLHALAEGYFQSLAVDGEGNIYAAAGAKGRVYEIRPDRTVLTAFDVDERQVNALLMSPKGLAFVTGDTGAVYQAKGAAKEAKYTSKVFDADFPARWGNLRWRSTGALSIETRSGNTSKPDRGWSAWAKPASVAKAPGSGWSAGRVASPTGRYLQYRVTWNGANGALREVQTYFLPQNQRPRVTEVTVAPDEPRKEPVTLQKGAAKPRSPVLDLKWTTENPDEDALAYKIEYRAEGDVEWLPVPVGEDPFTKTTFDWNTEALPDGHYRLRVTATDARVNPKDVALSDAKVSEPFLVDNQKPQVSGLNIGKGYASGRAVDSFSRITEISWSVDGHEWVSAYPKDGLFDDVAELFTFALPDKLSNGTHLLSVRVADEAGNIGATSVSFRTASNSSSASR